jgi:hypothetical protein
LKKARDQLILITREYDFYKSLSEKLEFRQTDELAEMGGELRQMNENEKDYKIQVELLQREN